MYLEWRYSWYIPITDYGFSSYQESSNLQKFNMSLDNPTYNIQYETLRIAVVPPCPLGISVAHFLQRALDGMRLIDENRFNPLADAGNTRFYWLLPPLEGFPLLGPTFF